MQLLDYVRNNQHSPSVKDEEENTSDSVEPSKDLGKKKTTTVIRKKKVFSKKNNQVTEKLEPKEKKVDLNVMPDESEQEKELVILNEGDDRQPEADLKVGLPDKVELNEDNSNFFYVLINSSYFTLFLLVSR